MSALYEQPVLPVADPDSFRTVKSAIESTFSAPHVEPFLRSLASAKLRIRDFEVILDRGLIGSSAGAAYRAMDNSDQGQIREFYLASLERVPATLREKFFKLYAYY